MTNTTSRRAFMAASAATLSVVSPGFACAQDAAASKDTTSPSDAPADKAPSGPPPVEVYAGAPLVRKIALSPGGKQVAVISGKDEDKLLVHFDVSDNKPHALRLGGGKMRGLFWVDEEHIMLITSQTTSLWQFAGSKQEVYLANLINITTNKTTNLFSQEEKFYNIVEGDIQRIKVDGKYRVTASSYRMEDPYPLCLYSFAPDREKGSQLCEGSKYAEGFVISPDGFVVAYSEFDDDRKVWTLYYNTGKPGSSRFTALYKAKDPLTVPSLEGIGRDGKSVVIFVAKGEAGGDYHEISADGVLSEPLGKPSSSTATPLFHPVTGRLAGFEYEDDWFTYDYDEPLMKKLAAAIPQVMPDGALTSIAGFGDDPRKMIIYAEGKGDAGSYAYADFSTGAVVPVASNYPKLPEEWISAKKAIDYKAADGLNIHAYLSLPPNLSDNDAKNLPLIVLPHGGPEARDYIDFDWQAQCLASRGYAVLQPNFRGSTGYGQAFIDASHGEFGRKMQTDLSDGVRYLASKGIIDPKRVAILGASYGGYAALAGATLDPGVYRCAVSVAGVADTRSFISFLADISGNDTRSSRVLSWKQLVGDQKGWDDISPARQAAKAYCPILMFHGTDDTVVPIDQSQRMERALKAAGKDVQLITYKGQDHWETVGPARIDMMKTALDFLQKHNPAQI